MSKTHNPSPSILQYDSESTSSKEWVDPFCKSALIRADEASRDSSSEDGEAPQVQDGSGSHNVHSNSFLEPDEVPKVQDRGAGHNVNKKERVNPLDTTTLADDSKGHRDSLQERDLVRKIPKPTVLTTAQQRTMINMFGCVAHASLLNPSSSV